MQIVARNVANEELHSTSTTVARNVASKKSRIVCPGFKRTFISMVMKGMHFREVPMQRRYALVRVADAFWGEWASKHLQV